ncbi:MAG TPA: DUF4184 family protein [Terriglobales bacterium]|jgi:hypothetical protein|nr:DUF4184 family protein [Terriglobales bacterium]
MPFTLSHAAAALPLRRLKLVTSALVIGTLAPDFEYFLRLAPDDGYGHTLQGAFLLTLPLALVTLWLFHAFVKLPLVGLFPDSIERRLVGYLEEFRFAGAARFALIVVSISVGIATHLVWDSFTHSGTWLYRNGPFLGQPMKILFFGPIPAYRVFQHTSTIVGIAALSIWLLLWYRNTKPSAQPLSQSLPTRRKVVILVTVAAIALVGAAIRSIIAVGIPANYLVERRFVGLWVVTLISLLWWQLVFYGVLRTRLQRTDHLA